jgi:hypothetical protein
MNDEHPTPLKRLMTGLACSAASGSAGFVVPIICFRLWREYTGGSFYIQDFSGLLAIFIALIGGIGGAISGLCIGIIWHQRKALSRAFAGQCAILCLVGLYTSLNPNDHERALCAWTAFPSAIVAGLMSAGLWFTASLHRRGRIKSPPMPQ